MIVGSSDRRLRWPLALLASVVALAVAVLVLGQSPASGRSRSATASGQGPTCRLGRHGRIRHVVYIQFDNVHLQRDNPNVPSDLQQMPHLLDFIEGNGTMVSHEQDVLQHTATNFLSGMTGLYPDRHGITQSNSYDYFNPDGSTDVASSFGYWTAPIYLESGHPTDPDYNQVYSADPGANPTGQNRNVPAPWVPFTRAGCNVGYAGMPGAVLENISADVPLVFGAGSPQAQEVTAAPAQASADFVGLAVHCARGASECTAANGARPDVLPDEPGGYRGYQALYGNKYVAPVIHPSGPVTSLSGQVISDGHGHVGFPGFDSMTPDNALAYTLDMQEHGVPVTYTYLSDAHDNHGPGPSGGFGPGQSGYTAQLRAYDQSFARFLSGLAAHGITRANTLFVVTTDEGDHFVGGPPTPAGCTGVTTPCTYQRTGEVNVDLPGLLATQQGDSTAFSMHDDPAPAIYVTGNPSRTAPQVRSLERASARLTVTNPLTGRRQRLTNYLADPVEEKILHLVDADPARTPTFTIFAKRDYYLQSGASPCQGSCVTEQPGYEWNHGTIARDMNTIWVGMVGPGVRHRGTDGRTLADQTDVRPTMMALLGLRDDYPVDGRVLTSDLSRAALPPSLQEHYRTVVALGNVYTKLEEGPGPFGLDTLVASTRALASGSGAHHGAYARIEGALIRLGADRDALGARMRSALLGAAFGGRPVNKPTARTLLRQGRELLRAAHRLAAGRGSSSGAP